MEVFCENFKLYAVNYFRKKAPLYIFDWVLNTPLGNEYLQLDTFGK